MKKLKKEIREHLDTFPQRKVQLETTLSEIKTLIKQHIESEALYRQRMDPLVIFWEDSTRWGKMSKRIFGGVVGFFLGMAIIIGTVIGFKEWIKK